MVADELCLPIKNMVYFYHADVLLGGVMINDYPESFLKIITSWLLLRVLAFCLNQTGLYAWTCLLVEAYLKDKYNKPGDAYLGLCIA